MILIILRVVTSSPRAWHDLGHTTTSTYDYNDHEKCGMKCEQSREDTEPAKIQIQLVESMKIPE